MNAVPSKSDAHNLQIHHCLKKKAYNNLMINKRHLNNDPSAEYMKIHKGFEGFLIPQKVWQERI